MTILRKILPLFLLLALAAFPQGNQNNVQLGVVDASASAWKFPTRLFANLPAFASSTGQRFTVTDCLTSACTAGSGTLRQDMVSTGSAWVPAITGSQISGLTTGTIPEATSPTALGDSPITDNGTTITVGGGRILQVGNTLLLGPCTGVDDTALVNGALATSLSVQFSPGTCVVTSLVPQSGATLKGGGTTIRLASSVTTGTLLDATRKMVVLADLDFDGGANSLPGSVGTRNGLLLDAAALGTALSRVNVHGFSGAGIAGKGGSTYDNGTPSFQQVNLYYNGTGLETRLGADGTGAEYLRIEGVSAYQNHNGINLTTGNLILAGSTITSNSYGINISSDSNGGHGIIEGNAVNHNSYALVANNVKNGMLIVGNQFWGGQMQFIDVIGFDVSHNTISADAGLILTRGGINQMRYNWLPTTPVLTRSNDFWRILDNPLLAGGYLTGYTSLAQANGLVYIQDPLAIGSEMITNGAFSSGASWTLGAGWTISGGAAHSAGGSVTALSQAAGLVLGNIYQVTYTVGNYVSGGVIVSLGGQQVGTVRTAAGTYTEQIPYNKTASDGSFYLYSGFGAAPAYLDVTNVSVKAVLGGVNGTPGITANGTTCSITSIVGGIITAATCI